MTDTPPATAAEIATMDRLIDRALEAAEDGGKAGISAAIMRGDTLLAIAENEVHLHHDPTRHAEIVAMSRATRALADPDLSGCTLLTTLQPCEMCLSAMRFAGIKRVIFAATKPNVELSKYFAFPDLDLTDFDRADHDGFLAIGGVQEDRIVHLYAKAED
ncbi:nucleoside deaminase [Pseudooceanicola sp. MF1-13]|uniref:nucleoside deaminase n=1 Tax=Pseudooceanicola sp. MF1-13 TaxID=3379095 RepID=UPI0038918457